MNQKIVIVTVAVLVIVIGGIYYFQNNYHTNPPENGQNIAPQNSNQISIENFAFSPAELSVNTGDTVTWTNNDPTPHKIIGSRIEISTNELQSNDLSKGQSYSFTFSSAGTYDYFCSIHPSMKGKIVVK